MSANLAFDPPCGTPVWGVLVMRPPIRAAFEAIEALASTMEVHPALDLGDPAGDSWFDLSAMRQPVFLHLQLEPGGKTERVAPVVAATCTHEPRVAVLRLYLAWPSTETIHWQELAAKVFAPSWRYRLSFPLAPVDRQEFLFDGDRAAVTVAPSTGEAEVRPPEILHGVQVVEDGSERRGVRSQLRGARQDEVSLPAALDRWDQLVNRRVTAALLQTFEFAVHGAEMFFGVVFVVEHGGIGWTVVLAAGVAPALSALSTPCLWLLGYASKKREKRVAERGGLAPQTGTSRRGSIPLATGPGSLVRFTLQDWKLAPGRICTGTGPGLSRLPLAVGLREQRRRKWSPRQDLHPH